MRIALTGAAVAAVVIVAVVLAFSWPSREAEVSAAAPQIRAGDIVRPASTEEGTRSENAWNTGVAPDPLVRLLSGDDPGRWPKAFRAGLGGLRAADLWDVLTHPGVEQQTQARLLREKLLHVCVPLTTPYIDVANDPTLPGGEASRAWCSGLAESAGSWEDLAAATRSLADDVDLATTDPKVLAYVDADGPLSPATEAMLTAAAYGSDDPFVVENAVRSLLYYEQTGRRTPVAGWEQLSPPQWGRLSRAATLLAACEAAGSCGPSSIWTAEYCMQVVGLDCPRGYGLDQIVARNLSAVEQEHLSRFLAHVRAMRRG